MSAAAGANRAMVRVATRGLVPWRRVNEELERVIAEPKSFTAGHWNVMTPGPRLVARPVEGRSIS